jgi:hypothetical protein
LQKCGRFPTPQGGQVERGLGDKKLVLNGKNFTFAAFVDFPITNAFVVIHYFQ